jgi:flagellar biosynthetic protein FliR
VDFTFAGGILAGYLIALGRTVGFVLVAPPFNSQAIPSQVRAVVAMALAVPLQVWTTPKAPALDSGDLGLQALLQLVIGATLGFLVMLVVDTVQTIGDLLDVAGGFSISQGLDPLGLNQSSVMGRLHQLIAVTLLMIGDGHLIVLQGLSRSIQILPTGSINWQDAARAAATGLSGMIMSAVQITAPILAALLLADLALGLLTRAAPALNAFSLAFPLKIMLTLFLIGLILVQIPGALDQLVDNAGATMLRLVGG